MDKEMQLLKEMAQESGARNRSFIEALVLPLLRSRYLVAASTVLGAFVGIFYSLTLPNDYRSTGKILVQLGARERATVETAGGGAVATSQVAYEEMQNELQIITVPSVYRSVAATVGPERILAPYNPATSFQTTTSWPKSVMHRFQAWWFGKQTSDFSASSAEKKLDIAARVLELATLIRPEGPSHVISVTYGTHDAVVARDVVAAFLHEFNKVHQEVFSTNPKLKFYEEAYLAARKESEAADTALSNYKTECEVYALETQRDILATSLVQREQEIETDKQLLSGLDAELQAFELLLAKYPEKITELLPTTEGANPEWTSLHDTLTELRIERTELRREYSEDAPVVKNKDAVIAAIETQLQSVKRLIATGGGEREINNPEYVRLKQKIDDSSAERARRHATLQKRQDGLAAISEKLQRLEECQPRLAALEHESAAKREVVKSMDPGLHDLRTKGELEQLNETNLRIIQVASLPTAKSGPSRGKFLISFSILGFMIGAAGAFLRNIANRTVRRPEDIENKLGTDVLAVVPELKRWQKVGGGSR